MFPANVQKALTNLRSGVDFIQSFDASGYPVRIASEVKGFDAEAVVGKQRRLLATCQFQIASADADVCAC
jgi:3-oxoacyl-(acyl-carrier-protein) synthase